MQAVEYVKSGMVVGLGTGSTAAFAVARIGELIKVWDERGTLMECTGRSLLPSAVGTASWM